MCELPLDRCFADVMCEWPLDRCHRLDRLPTCSSSIHSSHSVPIQTRTMRHVSLRILISMAFVTGRGGGRALELLAATKSRGRNLQLDFWFPIHTLICLIPLWSGNAQSSCNVSCLVIHMSRVFTVSRVLSQAGF